MPQSLGVLEPGDGDFYDRRGSLHARVRLDAEAQVRAVGALIAILQRDGLLLGGEASPAHLADIRERALEGYLTVDPESSAALGIFSVEAHPSHFIGSSKEGLSVFGLLDTCVTQARRTWRFIAARSLRYTRRAVCDATLTRHHGAAWQEAA
jgi:hypothetical protein